MKQITVIGSLNIDRFARVAALPAPGQTVMAESTFIRFGGKGANQALAAARLGARVTLVGAVGSDAGGQEYRARLAAEGIDTHALLTKPGATGTAYITVDAAGENTIIVAPEANGAVTAADIEGAAETIRRADVVVLQFELPRPAVLAALRLAAASNVPVVLNPSPWEEDFPWAETPLHTVIVNAGEATAWLGTPRHPGHLPLRRLVVTQGGGETLGFSADETVQVAPPAVRPVDTVGAGDAFAGAYAVALAEGRDFRATLRFANAAGACATQAVGAQKALPSRAAVESQLGP